MGVKIGEIVLYYNFALYLQSSGCPWFSNLVHIIYDIIVYNYFLDVLKMIGYEKEDIKFDMSKSKNRDSQRVKLVLNFTLLAISYISILQFTSSLSHIFFYFYCFTMALKLFQYCKIFDDVKKDT